MAQEFVCKVNEINQEQINSFQVADLSIIIVAVNGSFKAYHSLCPHEGGDLSEGSIQDGNIVCAMHNWNFKKESGQHAHSNACLKAYKTEIIQEELWVELPTVKTESKCPMKKLESLEKPKGNWLTGNLKEFSVDNKHQVLEDWSKEIDDVYAISLAGKKFIVSADPEINQEVLKRRPKEFRRFYKIDEILREMGVDGVFNAEGEAWDRHRKLTAEALNNRNVRSFFPALLKITERLKSRWLINKNGDNGNLNIQEEMMRFTVDITTKIAFGYDTETLLHDGDVIQNHLDKIFPMVNKRITAPLPIWRYVKSKKDKELDLALKEIQTLIQSLIERAKERLHESNDLKENPTNFLEALLVEQEKGDRFSDKEIFGNVFTMLLAGEDTTSNSISWTLFYLATHPEVLTKARQEVASVFDSEEMASSYDKLDQLNYIEACALESLRLKPVSPMLFMQANMDVEIKNLRIAKDQTIMLQNKVAQTDEKHFDRAADFIPDRWMPSQCPVHEPHSPNLLRTFGGGSRFCPGKQLAINEIKMVVSMLIHNFDFKLNVDKEAVTERFAFTMFPTNLFMNVSPRKEHPIHATETVI